MYFPYFRGKQYELITIRETASILANHGFVPIVEPVKGALNGLERTIKTVTDVGGKIIIITNPQHGDHKLDSSAISEFIDELYLSNNIILGFLLTEDIRSNAVREFIDQYSDRKVALLHCGFRRGNALSEEISELYECNIAYNIFFEPYCGILYRKKFDKFLKIKSVLLRDGFERRRNRDHPTVEFFSDLHITYGDLNMKGFGDFLTVGDEYSETGGPAYAVAIHITFIDPDEDDAMFVYHFVSDTQDTPADPGGKFYEALSKLVKKANSPKTKIYKTNAIQEFLELYNKKHFPGLGYVKKLSMKHHIETMEKYLFKKDA